MELFTRSGRGLELTEAGRAIAPCVDECLSSYDRLKAAVEALSRLRPRPAHRACRVPVRKGSASSTTCAISSMRSG